MSVKRNRSSFFISISLHFFGAALLFFFLHEAVLRPPNQKSLLIEIAAEAPSKSARSGMGLVGSKSRKAGPARSFQLKDLGVKYGWQVPTGEKSNSGSSAQENGDSHAVDIVKEGKESPLFKYVHDAIDNHLAYPAELKARIIQGTVTGAVVFAKGEFVEEQTRLQSDSSYLRVAVMRALRKAFRDALPEKYWQLAANSEGRLEVQCRFIFSVVEHDDEKKSQSLMAVSGHALAFYRTYVHSVLEWKLGPLSGLGPLVSLDVLWLPEKIGELFSKKAEIDPLENYRDDPAW